jgi:ketosteroid isomerase-like protein
MSVDRNHRDAFLAYFGDDAILLRPGAVNAKKWIAEHEKWGTTGLLTWDPSFAYTALDGDLGYTTGPWEYRQERSRDAKPVAYGYFVTIWRRTPAGWRVQFDHGTENPEPMAAVAPFEAPQVTSFMVKETAKREEPTSIDAEFTKALASQGAAKAYAAYLLDDARLQRNGKHPVLGKAAILAAVESDPNGLVFVPAGGGVSSAGDLAYVFGTIGEGGSYVRIWRRDPNGWRIALDLLSPPEPKQS